MMYYLSMEYLQGRALLNAVQNLGLKVGAARAERRGGVYAEEEGVRG